MQAHSSPLLRRVSLVSLLVSTMLLGPATTPVSSTPVVPNAREVSALEPAASGGLASLDRALVRLSTHRRLLMIAAHPDDEDTSLLTWVARGLGGEAAYLSLSRGDGGQNLLGPELGPGLGLLRSQELESARGVDGARQFFTRAYDFGYTRSIDETFERWPKEVLLEDTARVVRRFKPQVLMAVFPSSPQAGHGQHWASAVVADEIFESSGQASAFPQIDAEGLPPWSMSTFYRAAWWNPEGADLELPLGTLEPWSGRSILQLALDSRSQHRCQDMGSLQPLGDATGRLTWQAGGDGPGTGLFDGIDTSLPAIAALLEVGDLRNAIAGHLAVVEERATTARGRLDGRTPHAIAPDLLDIVRQLRQARELLGAEPSGVALHVAELIDEKRVIAQEAAATAAQVLVDAYTGTERVVLGETLEARSVFWNAGPLTTGDLEVEVVSHEGWTEVASAAAEPVRSRFATEVTDERTITVAIPGDGRPTVPYFFERPRQGDLFDWNDVPSAVQGEPFQPPPLAVRFRFTLDSVPIVLDREVVYRERDQARGEVRRPLRAVPALEVATEPSQLVWPLGTGARTVEVTVVSNLETATSGKVEIGVPEGWPAVDPQPFTIDDPRGRVAVPVTLEPPADVGAQRVTLQVAAVTDDGQRFDHAYPLVDYEHVRPTPIPRAANLEVTTLDLTLPKLERVGYVRGASDRVPEALAAVGVPIELLDGETLATGDLSVFDALVIGSRAYEVDRTLAQANPRLLDYTRAGGLLVVQYQQYQFVRGGHAPFSLDIHRPHDRVTDEYAPVRLLDPNHQVFQHPNRLTEADWQGWVQERGLYFAGTWDDAYTPLLAMADPGGDEKQGALLVAPLGEGTYVYTGLAFFRQLPAGVPGATRLLVNLLGL